MPHREPIRRTTRLPEDLEPDAATYDAAPPDLPPSPAGGGVETGGEPAASRRHAGQPPDALHRSRRTALDAEPFLGYDGLDVDDVLAWISDADPELDTLQTIRRYENAHLRRAPVLRECTRRIERLRGETRA